MGLNSYSQIDTTRKPVDTTRKPIDTTRNPIDTTQTRTVTDTTQAAIVDTTRSIASDTLSSLRVDKGISESFPAKEGRQQVYRLKPGIDIPLVVAGTAWSLYGFSQIYNKPSSTEAHINSLKISDLNGFDRWAADVFDEKAEKISDIPFYAAMPLPLIMLFDKKIGKDGWKYLFLYWETMAVNGIFYTGTPYIIDRYRPLAYNPKVPMYERTSGNAKNSFFAGHVGLVASSTFFMAKVYSDYHPDSKFRWVFWTGASAATLFTAYLRHAGAKHFPSDIVVGTAVGTLVGILVPHFHKNPVFKNKNLSVRPFTGRSHGLHVVYKL